MSVPPVLPVAMPLLGGAEAVAALGAVLALRDGGHGAADPELAACLDAVVAALGLEAAVAELSAAEAAGLAALVGGFLAQAADLVAHPTRRTWNHDDARILVAQGRTSALLAPLFWKAVVPALGGDLARRLDAEGARILDVGVGVGALAVALCRTWPQLHVVGLDPWEPALALAREEIAAAALEERIELRRAPVETLADDAAYDLAWVPMFFIPRPVLAPGVVRVHAALRPGGCIVLGQYASPPDPVGSAVAQLRTVRQGGTAMTPEQAAGLLREAGFVDVAILREPEMRPLLFIVGRRRAADRASVTSPAENYG